MKAVVFEGNRVFSLRDVPGPRIKDIKAPKKFKKGEYLILAKEELVLLDVEAASICGTDLHILEGTHDSSPPVVLGHEYVGRVREAGKSVTGLDVGDLVGVDPNIKCGLCVFCRRGMPNHCRDMTTLGIFINGGFAPRSIVPAKQLYRIPPNVPLERAVFFEPLSCVVHAFRNVEPKIGDSVLIYGGGTIGCIFALLSRYAGARDVIVVEPSYFRRNFISLKLGITAIQPGEEPAWLPADVTIDACGVASIIPRAIEFTRHGGRISLFGEQNIHASVSLNPTVLNQKELQMFGSYAAAYDFERTIDVLGLVPLEKIVTHVFCLQDIEQALECIRNGVAVEVIMKVGGDTK